ncbi:MAG: SDR family NAD(P)-dependent oxidoreductase [Bifidobacteriaceae bacterium]|jgi:short-subunit dehydrogenase|nr:SDR family NAD(P)-dependent oxidoreductase [Bifidobacteriaceae bacterium]
MGTALITGASSGLGLEFAWQLATLRHNLVLVARDAGRLAQHAERIGAAAGVSVEVLPADLADREQTERVAQRLRAKTGPVGLLVNNAGFGPSGSFLELPVEGSERALDVMARSVMVLSHAAANAMTVRGRGAICNVASVAAFTSAGPYSAVKAWVLSFTEGLASELAGTGVTATALLPGLTRTEFHARAGLDYSAYPRAAWLSAADVVATALADVRRGAVVSIPSLRYGVIGRVARVAPRGLVRAVARSGR